MKNKRQMIFGPLLFVCCMALGFPAQAQTIDKREAEVTTTQSLEFGAKGTIQIVDSFGSVKVEGWDKEEVEMTVTKRTQKKYEPKDLAKAAKGLERFKVTMEAVGETSLLVINTTYPSWTPFFRGKTNLKLDYLIKVPRQSTLLIKHGIGEVEVVNVSGDIEATASIGEISLRLPEDQSCAVDARVRIGDVSSEFGQTTHRKGLFAVGAKLAGEPATPTRRIYLRVGIGDINVSKLRAEKSGEQHDKKAAQSGPQEKEADVSVDFVVRVPKDVGFIGFTVAGQVETKSLASDVTAQSVLGDVVIELPSGVGARVQAECDLGGIESDWPLAQKARNDLGQSAQGVIGGGQYYLQLNTAAGNIRLRRAQQQ